MTLMPEVHDALVRAVAARPRRRRWWYPSRRAGLLAFAAVIVTGTALAATTGWRPELGSSDHGPRPLAANGPVPADQLAALAVLRRSQTAADRGPLVQQGLRVLSRRMINGIHTDAIRVIFRTPRELALLVPAERVGDPSHSVTVQRNVLCLMSTSFQQARTVTITQHGKPKIIHLPAGYNGWGVVCGGLDKLRTTGIETGTGPVIINGLPKHPTIHRITLVPDGVARVTVRLRHNRTVTVPVSDNVYRYTIHESPASMGTIWFDASGRRIDHRKHR